MQGKGADRSLSSSNRVWAKGRSASNLKLPLKVKKVDSFLRGAVDGEGWHRSLRSVPEKPAPPLLWPSTTHAIKINEVRIESGWAFKPAGYPFSAAGNRPGVHPFPAARLQTKRPFIGWSGRLPNTEEVQAKLPSG